MLEYMLIRPIENAIWDKTRHWLNSNPYNKFLIVLDEAHMYRGAPGGEIALLLRRLMNRLDIPRDKLQFILTSASMPDGKDDELLKFVIDLTAADMKRISIIRGVPEVIAEGNHGTRNDAEKLALLDVTNIYSNANQYTVLKHLSDDMGWTLNEATYKNELYDILIGLPYMRVLIKETRSKACTTDELKSKIFPDVDSDTAERAIESLIVLGAIAKKNDVYLLPMRSHILMRGIRTAYMCINPDCPDAVSGDGLKVGNITINKKQNRCELCGCLNFEVYVDRRCKGIFVRGYQSQTSSNDILWNVVDPLIAESFAPIDIYLIPDNLDAAQMDTLRNSGQMGYLIANTGEFEQGIAKRDDVKGVRVIKNNNGFSTCPSCNKRNLNLQTLTTRGNEPFSNVVFEQLWRQTAKNKSADFPNEGKKVLLFSDSRQRAARLARDMTIAADGDAGRKTIMKAAKLLCQWSDETDREITLDDLYGMFVKIVYDKKLSFFYGEDEQTLQDDLGMYERRLSRNPSISRIIDRFNGTRPELYSRQLLRQLTDSFQSLHDLALGYLDVSKKFDDDLRDLADDIGIEVNSIRKIIQSWLANVIVRDKAIGTNISDDVRRNLLQYGQERPRFGLERVAFSRGFRAILTQNGFTDAQQDAITLWIEDLLTDDNSVERNGHRYIKLDAITLRVADNEEWVRCSHCCSVFKHALFGQCVFCGSTNVETIDGNYKERMAFWRDPVIDVLRNEVDYEINSVNVAEHTAQLNYVDKEEKALATTEKFEMLFQDFIDSDENRPIDILSCTTTMEVGIDIGSLTAIGMRNIPPTRNNYQQRAGRAGRKSSSVSTVVTYTEDGPHDSWYYLNPNDIVRGTPSTPWIDIYNEKLTKRHLNIVALTKYFRLFAPDKSIDSLYAYDFFLTEGHPTISGFADWIRSIFRFSSNELHCLIPSGAEDVSETYYLQFANDMDLLAEKAAEDPNILIIPQNEDDNNRNYLPYALDILYKEGILPTYSFPRDVVNYWIENKYGKIEETPQRSIEMALSDYAPGRTIVVNKKTYVSGGLYNHFNRKNKNAQNKYAAAEPWLGLNEYKGFYYHCQRCEWMSKAAPKNGICPLCGVDVSVSEIIKPWGFASKDGKNIPEIQDNQVYSSSSIPQYSTIPNTEQMSQVAGVSNLRIEARTDQHLMVVNTGPDNEGFRICSLCGAAEPSVEDIGNEGYHLRPYKVWPQDNQKCFGEFIENITLGYEFLTDLLVLEIPLNADILNANIFQDQNLWLKPAVCTFAEALAKAAGIVLDVEAQDIQSGYRFRLGEDNRVFADVYLYDKLVSGAGYSTIAAKSIVEILKKTREVLSDCTCSDSCPNCLQHFRNQRIQPSLNRILALQLVDWIIDDKVQEKISLAEQERLLSGLKDLLDATGKGTVLYSSTGSHAIKFKNKSANIVVYPCMWSRSLLSNQAKTIYLPDRIAENGLPLAFNIVEEYFLE